MTLFGLTHGLVVLTIFALALICIRSGRSDRLWPRAALAFICLSVYPMSQLAYYYGLDFETPLNNLLPFHLCDIVALTAGFALLTRKPLLCELTYCWGLAGTLQGLITPSIAFPSTHPIFWSFFIHHGVIVIVALYLPLAMGWRPRAGVVPRVLIWNQVYFVFAIVVNTTWDTNFGFLAHKPDQPTILDHFGDWPVYLIWIQIFAAVVMTLLLFPFRKTINIWRTRGIRVSPS